MDKIQYMSKKITILFAKGILENIERISMLWNELKKSCSDQKSI